MGNFNTELYYLKTTFRYGPPTRTDHRLIVENLSSRISWQVIPFDVD